jgi:hypothetical protein
MLVADGRAIEFYRKCGFVQTMTIDGKMLLVKPDAANPAIGNQQLAQESCVFRAPPEKHGSGGRAGAPWLVVHRHWGGHWRRVLVDSPVQGFRVI